MISDVLAKFRLLASPTPSGSAMRRVRSRRKSARAAVWSGVAAFAALTAGMAVAIDTVRPEWRDPEFALRLRQVREWKAKAPHRPLVLAFGSSRTQMGLSPAAMGLPDEPGSPVVYNFGYRAAHPLGVWFHFTRVLDSGVKPDAVLIQLAAPELMVRGNAEKQLGMWGPRFSRGDIALLLPYTKNDAVFRRAWLKSHLNPWTTYREPVISDLAPDWHTTRQRKDFEWEQMDEYGFSRHPFSTIPLQRRRELEENVKRQHARALKSFAPGPTPEPVFRNLIERCRAEGIEVAFYWAPESPAYQGWHAPASLAVIEEYKRWFAARFPVPVFPAAEHLEELDFADGYHLLPHGAAKYCRWLADNHLRPWLVSQGLAK